MAHKQAATRLIVTIDVPEGSEAIVVDRIADASGTFGFAFVRAKPARIRYRLNMRAGTITRRYA